ncbi:AbrB family transcriptional regulator [Gloeobacter kilaueensis]|uniref:SpoVT-AbrB domain-containing protein n=1 Tax=Gloeobacter kilaueensis (strain ATCC BAA-2537 / CCAP 1431/1 / ULC 316 / JS1) TaxID=1183438 RepID=U5QIN2_GLOK1|nr:AbrB family transcriptional regulator [Gloeobacter kilaueensis]AGY58748.1 hypothetical protein GKIL_2502 [Gloeobacter kilaueensis JS1]
MAAFQGKELLKLIKENQSKSAKQLAELAGYTTVTKSGQKRVKMLAFQSAILQANNISLTPQQEEGEGVRGGRKASYRIKVQQNGNLLIGTAYTRQMGLEPGTEFEIQIGRKHIKLVQLDGSSTPENTET